MNWQIFLYIPILLIWSLVPRHVLGQCDYNSITRGLDLYKLGRFDETRQLIGSCIAARGFSIRADRHRALRLLALLAISEDSLNLAEKYIKTIVLEDPGFTADPHLVFDPLFQKILKDNQTIKVYSVSKQAEDIRTAPATVMLVTREEMLRRGYMDLIDLLADLPGFEISRIFSATYANVFQLGFRQENTERTLFMIDGVEENDLWSNIAYISRQYPLSSIKAVEVIYGPSSTMYGPRAFVGAINVITGSPVESNNISTQGRDKNEESRNKFAISGILTRGSARTTEADLTLAYHTPEFQISLTGRYFYSDEDDLSFVNFYDYSTKDIDRFSYGHMNLKGNFTLSNVGGVKKSIPLTDYVKTFSIPSYSPFYNFFEGPGGRIDSIVLTPQGINQARELDKQAYVGQVNGAPAGFSNHSRDYYLSARVYISHFTVGISTWKTSEGFNFYQDIYSPGSRNGSLWVPRNLTFFSRYEREFGRLSLRNLTTYHDHGVDKTSNRVNFQPFGLPASGLHLAHLLSPDSLFVNTSGTSQVRHGYSNLFFYYEAKQLRNDFQLFYNGSGWDFSSGLEYRSTLTQGDYLNYTDYQFRDKINQRKTFFAQELGTVRNQEKGSNLFDILDLGIYTQTNISFIPNRLRLNVGARLDYNQIRSSGGFGFGFSPRMALILQTGMLTFKGIYSRGLQNVSQWTKFSTGGGRTPNPDLGTEKIDFLNFSVLGFLQSKSIPFELSAFIQHITDAVASSTDNRGITQNRNIGAYRVAGTLAVIKYSAPDDAWHGFINHTYMHPFQIADGVNASFSPVRIGDIAAHHANVGLDRFFKLKRWRLITDIRGNYVGNRKVGPGTTQAGNLGVPGNMVKAYLVFNGAIHLSPNKNPGLRLSLLVNNILNNNPLDSGDNRYYHPGPRGASASYSNVSGNVPFIPQRPRWFMVRLTLGG